MTDIKPGDEVTVTITSTVNVLGHYMGSGYYGTEVYDGNPASVTVEVTKRANSAANDSVGTLRGVSDEYPKRRFIKTGDIWVQLSDGHGFASWELDLLDSVVIGHALEKPEDDAKGWVLTLDNIGDYWRVRDSEYFFSSRVDPNKWYMSEYSTHACYKHTPITASELPDALREAL